jgi:hypothetical protein
VELPPTSKRKREKEDETQSMNTRNPRNTKEPVSISQEKGKGKGPDLPMEPKRLRPVGDFSVAIRAMRGLAVRPSEPEKQDKPVSLCSKVNYVQPVSHLGVIGITGSSSENRRGSQGQHLASAAHTRISTVGVEAAYDFEGVSPVKGSPGRTVDGRRTNDSGGRNNSGGGSSRGNGKSNNRDKKRKEVPLPSRRSSR